MNPDKPLGRKEVDIEITTAGKQESVDWPVKKKGGIADLKV